MRLNRLAAHSGADHSAVLVAWVVDPAAMHRTAAILPHQRVAEPPLVFPLEFRPVDPGPPSLIFPSLISASNLYRGDPLCVQGKGSLLRERRLWGL